MNELYELRIYPKPSDVYEDDGKFHLIWKYVTLDQANKLIDAYKKVYDVVITGDGSMHYVNELLKEILK